MITNSASHFDVLLIGTVKKVGALRIVHEKFRAKKVAGEYEQFKNSFSNAIAAAPELKPHIDKAHEDMNPLRVLNLFKAITDEVGSTRYFGFQGRRYRRIGRTLTTSSALCFSLGL